MQSTSRQLKRGNAHIVFNNVTKSNEIVTKRGTEKKRWQHAVKESMPMAKEEYIENTARVATQSIQMLKDSK